MGKEVTKKGNPKKSLINLDRQSSPLFNEYQTTRNNKTRNKIVEKYEPLVRAAALKIFKNDLGCVGYEDIVQEGFIGLIQAAEKFDVTKETRFSAYAYKRILGSMRDSFRRLDWVPRLVRQRSKIINSAYDIAQAKNGKPTEKEIVKELTPKYTQKYNLIVKDIIPLKMLSLEKMLDYNGYVNSFNQNQILEHKTQKNSLEIVEEENFWKELSREFSERERIIIFKYYRKDILFKKIAEGLGLSEARVSQINKSIVQRLKTNHCVLEFVYNF